MQWCFVVRVLKVLTGANCFYALFALTLFAAQASAEATKFTFNLNAQPLTKALVEYSRIVGQPVLFNPQQIGDLKAPPLQGELTSAEAINALLIDSKLQAEPAPHGWLVKPIEQQNEVPLAQADTPLSSQQAVLEETVVIGQFSESLRTALAQKAAADQWVDIILAQDMGKFPALNIAEALQRSSGISVVRDRGEALFVSIRGLPPSFNTVTLNGRPLASNENVRNSEQYGRRFHYDTFPVELVAGVEVQKTTTAADNEGAIGGNVNIRTYQPLALARTQFSTTLAASHPQLADVVDPRVSALGAWVNNDQTFGLLVATAYAERSLRQDRALNFGWTELPETLDVSHNNPENSSRPAIISPGSVRPTLEQEARKRLGLNAALQWRPSSQLAVEINLIDLLQRIAYEEFSYSADYELDQLLSEQNRFRNDALIGGATATGAAQISRESAGLVARNRAQDMAIAWSAHNWQLRLEAAHSQADSYNDDPIKRTRLRRTGDVGFRFWYPQISGDRVPQLDYQNISLADYSAFPGRRLEWRTLNVSDNETSAAFNAEFIAEQGVITSVASGLQWRQRTRRYARRDAIINDGIAGKLFPQDYFEAFPVANFLGEADGNLPIQWLIPNEHEFWQGVDEAALASAAPSAGDLRNSYAIDENILAAFVQLNFAGPRWRGNLGIRAANNRQMSRGYRLDEAPSGESASPVGFTLDYHHLLPTANFVTEINSKLLWRSAVAQVINRPDLQDLAPRLTLNSGDQLTAVGGTPNLKPVVAWQYDSALEWYFVRNSLLSVGIFYKDLDRFIQTDISPLLFNGQVYQLTAKSNGASANVSGLELNYQQVFYKQPAPLHQAGVYGNYTYTESSANYRSGDQISTDVLADVARNSINLGMFVEWSSIDLRLNYSWRDAVLSEVGTGSITARNSAAFGSLDMQTALHFSRDVSLVLEAINLTNAAQEEYVAEREFAGYTHYGRTFIAGIKLNF